MFSQTVEYALRAMVHLAHMSPEPQTTDQIAIATKAPKAYLVKVLQGLADAGLLKSQRGVKGGISLVLSPKEVTILSVVNAVYPIVRIRTCPLGLAAHGAVLCPLHKRMDEAMQQMENAFGSSTLAEILSDPSPSIPLCDFPARGSGSET